MRQRTGGRPLVLSVCSVLAVLLATSVPTFGRVHTRLPGHTNGVHAIEWLPDGSRVISGGGDKVIRLWDVSSGALTAELTSHDAKVVDLAVSPDGLVLASVDSGGVLVVWDLATQQPVHCIEGRNISCVAFSPDGKMLAVGAGKNVSILQVEDLSVERTCLGHSHYVQQVTFSPDGSVLASTSRDGTLKLWDPDSTELVHDLSFSSSPTGLQFTGEGACLLATDKNRMVAWETASMRKVCEGHGNSAFGAFSFDPHARLLVTNQWKLSIWELPKGLLRQKTPTRDPDLLQLVRSGARQDDADTVQLAKPDRELYPFTAGKALRFSPDGCAIAIGDHQGGIHLYRTADLRFRLLSEPLLTHASTGNGVGGLTFTTDGDHVLVGEGGDSGDGRIVVLSAQTGRPVRSLAIPAGTPFDVAVSPDGKRVAATASTERQRICVWSLEDSKLLNSFHAMYIPADKQQRYLSQLRSHSGWTAGEAQLVFVRDPQTLAVFHPGDRTKLTYCNTASGQTPRVGGPQIKRAEAMAASRDGRWLALGGIQLRKLRYGQQNGITLLDTTTGAQRVLLEYKGGATAVHAMCFSSSGDSMAVAVRSGARNSIEIYDTESGRVRERLLLEKSLSNLVMEFLDERILAVAETTWDQVELWDIGQARRRFTLETGRNIKSLAAHPGSTCWVVRDTAGVHFWVREPYPCVSHSPDVSADTAIRAARCLDAEGLLVADGIEAHLGSSADSLVLSIAVPGKTGPDAERSRQIRTRIGAALRTAGLPESMAIRVCDSNHMVVHATDASAAGAE